MSQWYYQMLGEEFGPVPGDALKQLLAEGMLADSDLVRATDSDDWVTLQSITPFADSSAESAEVLTDLSELSFQFEESGAAARPARRQSAGIGQPAPGDIDEAPQWFHQFSGQELGPASLTELVQMAESGNLSAVDLVRCGAAAEWQQAGDIPELAAACFLNSGANTTEAPQSSAASGRSLFASAAAEAAATRTQADAAAAAVTAAAAAIPASAAAAETVNPAEPESEPAAASARAAAKTTSAPTGAAAPAASKPSRSGKGGGRRAGRKAEERLVDDILSEVFSEPEPPRAAAPAVGTVGSAGALVEGDTEGGQSRSAVGGSGSVSGSGWSGSSGLGASGASAVSAAPGPRPSLSAARPSAPRSKSSGSLFSGISFSMSGQTAIILGVLVLVVGGWLSYGPINRMMTIDEAKYMGRAEEFVASLEKSADQAGGAALEKLHTEIYQECNLYLNEMRDAGATSGKSRKCLAALSRLAEVTRVDPRKNPDIRQKLLADVKQLISAWKAL